MAKILIAGSMKATQAMCDFARECVEDALYAGDTIIVGDNPSGIDKVVILECYHTGTNCVIHGIDKTPRYKLPARDFMSYKKVDVDKSGFGAWSQRDRFMCHIADRGIFIWNGISRGTKAGYDYMLSIGTPAAMFDDRL